MLSVMTSGKEAVLGQWLWDLIPLPTKPTQRRDKTRRKPPPPDVSTSHIGTTRTARQQHYKLLVDLMKQQHRIRVRKWRTHTTGCAWQITYEDGSITRLIEAPYPRSPISAAVFLHEVGHHAIGFNRYKPRCLEELKAWEWALAAMKRHDIPVTAHVQKRVESSLRYAVGKAQRRGIKHLPDELKKYTG